MGQSLSSMRDGLLDFMCGNIFVEAGIAAAGLQAIRKSSFYGAAGVAIASYAFGKACDGRGFDPDIHLPSQPLFQGGQCVARYNFQIRCNRANGSTNLTGMQGWGAISGFRIVEDGGSPSGYVQVFWRGGEGSPSPSAFWQFVPFSGGFGSERTVSFEVLSVTRVDGQPDNCGSLPGREPDIIGDPDDPLDPGEVDVTYVDPDNPENNREFKQTVFNFSVDKLLGVDGPLVNFDVGGVKVSLDLGDEDSEPQDPNNDAAELAKKQYEKLEELEKELEAAKECVCTPRVEVESLYLPATVCSVDSQPSQVLRQFMVAKDSYSDEDIALFNNSADLASVGCSEPAVYAVPDSYNQRRQHAPPTLILVFRKEGSRAYHSYSIPNPSNSSKDQVIPIESFEKGSFLGTIYFSDNSACMANCSTRSEAIRVITAFSDLVDPAFLGEDSYIRVVERVGSPIPTATMNLTSSAFYPDGNRTLKPAWRRRYTPGI